MTAMQQELAIKIDADTLRSAETGIRRAQDLMECAELAARWLEVGPGTDGIVAALIEAHNALSDVMDTLGITKPEG